MVTNEMDFLRKSVDQLKDDFYKVQTGPSEEEFSLMRGRLETAENNVAMQGKRVSEVQKVIK